MITKTKLCAVFAFLLVFAADIAVADPWYAYGQTVIPPNGVVQNPQPNVNGLIGAVTSLPYTVPAGKILIVKMFQMEALWGGAILPWIGDTLADFTAANCLSTVNSDNINSGMNFPASFLFNGFTYHIPAGKKLNIRLSANYANSTGWIYGWYVGGELINAP